MSASNVVKKACIVVTTSVPQFVIYETVKKGMEHKGEQRLYLWYNCDTSIVAAVIGKITQFQSFIIT